LRLSGAPVGFPGFAGRCHEKPSKTDDMRLTKRGEYALRALIDLGIAQSVGRPMIQIGELAQRENIPIKFLEQILVTLKEAGYLESRRGKRGGYLLGKPMQEITIGEVVRLLDGPLAPIPCVSQNFYSRCSCPDETHCGLRMLMLDVRNAIADILDRYTLAQTVEVTLRKFRRDGQALPFSKPIPEQRVTAPAAAARTRGAMRNKNDEVR